MSGSDEKPKLGTCSALSLLRFVDLSGSDDKLKFTGHSAGTFGPIHCIPKRSESIPEKLKYFMQLPSCEHRPDPSIVTPALGDKEVFHHFPLPGSVVVVLRDSLWPCVLVAIVSLAQATRT